MTTLKQLPAILRQNIRFIGLLLLVFAITFTALFVYAGNKGATGGVSAAPCPVETCISLDNETATPSIVTIKKDSYVQFNAVDGRQHNIALAHSAAQHDDPSRYESGDFQGDEAWKVQFKHDGAYTFRDKANDKVKIDVVVYTEGKDYKVQ